jgi:hypothetical protein
MIYAEPKYSKNACFRDGRRVKVKGAKSMA